MKRGEIFWCDLEPRRGHEQGSVRPVAIISADAYNQSRSSLVCVLPLTTARAKNPIHLQFDIADTGLAADSTALVDQIRFVDRGRLEATPVGSLSPAAMARVERNLTRILGLNEHLY